MQSQSKDKGGATSSMKLGVEVGHLKSSAEAEGLPTARPEGGATPSVKQEGEHHPQHSKRVEQRTLQSKGEKAMASVDQGGRVDVFS